MRRDVAGLVVRSLVAVVCFLGVGTVSAQALLSQGVGGQEASVPRLMQFSGVLRDSLGRPLAGVQGVTFALYREPEGGSPLWLETQNVTADAEGRFAVLLGATTSEGVPLEGFSSGESRWLGVQAQAPGEAEQPRVLLVSVPYALKAADAETLGGKPLSAFLLAEASSDSPSRAREQADTPKRDGLPSAALEAEGQGAAASGESSDAEANLLLSTAALDGTGVQNRLARWFDADTIEGSDIFNDAGGKVGIGSTAPATALDVSGTIRAVLGPGAPFGTYLMPTGGAANSFRFGFGNNFFFDGTNWKTKGDGANNAGSGILTDIATGQLAIFTLPSTGPSDQTISDSGVNSFEKVRITGGGRMGIGTSNPETTLDVAGTIRAVLGPGAPFGTYLMPTGGAANDFRFGFGNNLFFDGTNWRTRGDGANNAGSAILTDIGLGHLQVFTLPSTGATDQVISNASFANFEKLRITSAGNVGIGKTNPAAKLDVNGTVKATAFEGSSMNITGTGGGIVVQDNATSPNIIGGFSGNTVTGGAVGATISGGGQSAFGNNNRVTDNFGVVGGGQNNQAGNANVLTDDAETATVAGGGANTASAAAATISGGTFNLANAGFGTIGGGFSNVASGTLATIGGGAGNIASGRSATIGGGGDKSFIPPINEGNAASGDFSTIGGGHSNSASVRDATVGGGFGNIASGQLATVGGGTTNIASAVGATIGGGGDPGGLGFGNRVTDDFGTVGGGGNNQAGNADGDTTNSRFATVGGGQSNTASGTWATVGGGIENTASNTQATVGGGGGNTASGPEATVGGGIQNMASGILATVGGGQDNTASSLEATVGGGLRNTASNVFASVAGGADNTASGGSATVGGGQGNTASGGWATVPGGLFNQALGDYSFAAGRRAKANHAGAFVWGDSSDFDVASSADNQFTARATGGVRFFTDTTLTNNCTLAPGGGSWSCTSDRNAKENFGTVSGSLLLEKLNSIPIETWNFRSQDDSIRHMGPMAQDFYAAFGLGEDDKHISTVDADGVALAGVQALYRMVGRMVQEKDAQIQELTDQVRQLRKAVEELKRAVVSE